MRIKAEDTLKQFSQDIQEAEKKLLSASSAGDTTNVYAMGETQKTAKDSKEAFKILKKIADKMRDIEEENPAEIARKYIKKYKTQFESNPYLKDAHQYLKNLAFTLTSEKRGEVFILNEKNINEKLNTIVSETGNVNKKPSLTTKEQPKISNEKIKQFINYYENYYGKIHTVVNENDFLKGLEKTSQKLEEEKTRISKRIASLYFSLAQGERIAIEFDDSKDNKNDPLRAHLQKELLSFQKFSTLSPKERLNQSEKLDKSHQNAFSFGLAYRNHSLENTTHIKTPEAAVKHEQEYRSADIMAFYTINKGVNFSVREKAKSVAKPKILTIDDIIKANDELLENNYDYAKFLFPIPEQSIQITKTMVVEGKKTQVPVNDPRLTPVIKQYFQKNPEKQLQALERILKVYGFKLTKDGAGNPKVMLNENFSQKADFWMGNKYRLMLLTRIIRSLSLTGHTQHAQAIMSTLETLYDSPHYQSKMQGSMEHWRKNIPIEKSRHLSYEYLATNQKNKNQLGKTFADELSQKETTTHGFYIDYAGKNTTTAMTRKAFGQKPANEKFKARMARLNTLPKGAPLAQLQEEKDEGGIWIHKNHEIQVIKTNKDLQTHQATQTQNPDGVIITTTEISKLRKDVQVYHDDSKINAEELSDLIDIKSGQEKAVIDRFNKDPNYKTIKSKYKNYSKYKEHLVSQAAHFVIRCRAPQIFAIDGSVLEKPIMRTFYYLTYPNLETRGTPEFKLYANHQGKLINEKALKEAYKSVIRLGIRTANKHGEGFDLVTPNAFLKGLLPKDQDRAKKIFAEAAFEVAEEETYPNFKGLFLHQDKALNAVYKDYKLHGNVEKRLKIPVFIGSKECDSSTPQRVLQELGIDGNIAETVAGHPEHLFGNGALGDRAASAKEENDTRKTFGLLVFIINKTFNKYFPNSTQFQTLSTDATPKAEVEKKEKGSRKGKEKVEEHDEIEEEFEEKVEKNPEELSEEMEDEFDDDSSLEDESDTYEEYPFFNEVQALLPILRDSLEDHDEYYQERLKLYNYLINIIILEKVATPSILLRILEAQKHTFDLEAPFIKDKETGKFILLKEFLKEQKISPFITFLSGNKISLSDQKPKVQLPKGKGITLTSSEAITNIGILETQTQQLYSDLTSNKSAPAKSGWTARFFGGDPIQTSLKNLETIIEDLRNLVRALRGKETKKTLQPNEAQKSFSEEKAKVNTWIDKHSQLDPNSTETLKEAKTNIGNIGKNEGHKQKEVPREGSSRQVG